MNKKNKVIGETTKCLICLEDAEVYSGNVKKGEDAVIAGWCEAHKDSYIFNWDNKDKPIYCMNDQGCHGGWHESYGIRLYEEEKEE